MKMLVLDVVERVSKSGKPYCQAALRGTGKNGDFLFVANGIQRWHSKAQQKHGNARPKLAKDKSSARGSGIQPAAFLAIVSLLL